MYHASQPIFIIASPKCVPQSNIKAIVYCPVQRAVGGCAE